MDRKSWSLESNTLEGQFFNNNNVINGRMLIYRMEEEPSWRYLIFPGLNNVQFLQPRRPQVIV